MVSPPRARAPQQYLLDTMPTGREEVGGPQWRRMIVLGCVGIAIAYSDRSNISTAIVAMKEEFGWCAGHCRACFGLSSRVAAALHAPLAYR